MLTGTFADGLGNVIKQPNRIDFDPFPWQSFAVWIMTQMKRWGQVKGDIDYKAIAEQVYLATDTAKLMKEAGLTPPTATTKSFSVMGKCVRSDRIRTSTSPASRSRRRRDHARCALLAGFLRMRRERGSRPDPGEGAHRRNRTRCSAL